MKHILIDFENIQPTSFDIIDSPEECHIWLFLGIHQQRTLPYPLAKSLFRFPNAQVHFLEMQHVGKNALDHYLSFYLGKISELDHQAEVYILARDCGYDVLVEHLNKTHHGLSVFRLKNVQSLPNVWQETTLINSIADDNRSNNIDNAQTSNNATQPEIIINQHQIIDLLKDPIKDTISPAFIHHCFKTTLKTMTDTQGYLPRFKPNFLSAVRKYALHYEIADYNNEQIHYLLEKVFEKFVNYNLIEIIDNKLVYKISITDMLQSIKSLVLQQRPKTIDNLKATIRNRLQSLNQSIENDEVNLVIKLLKKEEVLFQQHKTILYENPNALVVSETYLKAAKRLIADMPKSVRPKTSMALQNWCQQRLKLGDSNTAKQIVQGLTGDKIIIINENGQLNYQ